MAQTGKLPRRRRLPSESQVEAGRAALNAVFASVGQRFRPEGVQNHQAPGSCEEHWVYTAHRFKDHQKYVVGVMSGVIILLVKHDDGRWWPTTAWVSTGRTPNGVGSYDHDHYRFQYDRDGMCTGVLRESDAMSYTREFDLEPSLPA